MTTNPKKSERIVILDTETTGQDHKTGDRIVEIGCIELVDRVPTGRVFHKYLNPEGRKSHPKALQVHGLTDEFLADKPTFRSIAGELREFLEGSTVLIHNKEFDVGFLNAEFARIEKPSLWDFCDVECTLELAQSFFPNQRCSLDKLCERLEVDNSGRSLHGALLDAQLLLEVFLKMTKDAEPFIDDEALSKKKRPPIARVTQRHSSGILVSPTQEDLHKHQQYLENLEKEYKVRPVEFSLSESGTPTNSINKTGPKI